MDSVHRAEEREMTERKPPGVSFESWTDKQIREAEERGAFAGLSGAGKPLESLDTPYDELWWIKGKMQREGLSMLPPTLILRKEAEDAEAAVETARSEQQVRRILTEVNAKIAAATRRPPPGPPLNRAPFDVEQMVEQWRARQSVRAAEPPANAPTADPRSANSPAADARTAGLGTADAPALEPGTAGARTAAPGTADAPTAAPRTADAPTADPESPVTTTARRHWWNRRAV
jgi:hypothetical protein